MVYFNCVKNDTQAKRVGIYRSFLFAKREVCMSKITEEVETLIQPVLEALNYELVEVEFVKEGKDHFLRVSIDKEGGVDLNDCTLASEKLVK